MGEEIVFTIRLTSDDWDPSIRAWRCPVVDIPSTFIKTAYDAKGQLLATDYLKIEKGPARVSWKGPDKSPTQIALVIGLKEELSPSSEGRFWKRLAIVVPIITALISAAATYVSRPEQTDTALHTLRLSVDPTDPEALGLPPARITVNSELQPQPINYKIKSDVIAVVDVSKAFNLAKEQKKVIGTSVSNLNAIFGLVNDLNARVTADICPGPGFLSAATQTLTTQSPLSESLSAQATEISAKLKGISSDLQGALASR